MRKSTLFISAALTTFLLVMLFGVVSAYQAVMKSNPVNVSTAVPVAQQQPVSVVEPASTLAPTSQAAPVTPEQAAQLAAQILGRTDLYSVETSSLNGVDAYLVTFSSGDLVYVSLTGQILSITQLPVFTASSGGGGGDGGGNGGSNGGGEHESDGEHEGGDD
ncbi:MAG: hypothetical protein MUO77_00570 [Anaerolineales bacterium]|nr:hypothetical protein [Anaerolineales bacterium]